MLSSVVSRRTTTFTLNTIRKEKSVITMCLALASAITAGPRQCMPTAEMEAQAKSGGYELVDKHGAAGGDAWTCGDVNGDGRLDLCASLVKDGTAWKTGCFVSREERYKFETLSDSKEEGLQSVAPTQLSLEIVKKGTMIRWSNDAAKVSLLRDCVSFGLDESASRLYCYNGAYFLSMQMSD